MVSLSLKSEKNTRLSIAKTGRSLREFSKAIGISHAYLSQILSGKRNPSPTVGGKIAKGLGEEIEDVFLIKMSVINGQSEAVKQ